MSIESKEFYPYSDLSDVAYPEGDDTEQNDVQDWTIGEAYEVCPRGVRLGTGVLTAGGNYARLLDI